MTIHMAVHFVPDPLAAHERELLITGVVPPGAVPRVGDYVRHPERTSAPLYVRQVVWDFHPHGLGHLRADVDIDVEIP